MATSALKARLGTEMLMRNMTSRRKELLRLSRAKGPPPASVPHRAKHERMTATVAVARWSHRSAAHNSGRIARNPNAPRYVVCSMSGLYATTPTAIAATTTAPVARNWERPKDCRSIVAHKTTNGAKTSAPADVAEPPGHPDRRYGGRVDAAGQGQASDPDRGADHCARNETNQRKFRDIGRRLERFAAVGPEIDQPGSHQRLEHIAGSDRRRSVDRSSIRHVGSERSDQDRRSDAIAPHQRGRQGKSSCRPDRARARIDRGQRQADLSQHEIDHADGKEFDNVGRQVANESRPEIAPNARKVDACWTHVERTLLTACRPTAPVLPIGGAAISALGINVVYWRRS